MDGEDVASAVTLENSSSFVSRRDECGENGMDMGDLWDECGNNGIQPYYGIQMFLLVCYFFLLLGYDLNDIVFVLF